MFAKITSLGVYALDGFCVRVEADISGGLPAFTIVGLPDSAVKEATERVRSALKNLGFTYPVSRITINLAPADKRKTGPVYDLPVLLSILAASGQIHPVCESNAFVGEVSLDGAVRSVSGILPMAICAQKNGVTTLFVPAENACEAAIVEGLTVYGVATVREVVQHLSGEALLAPTPPTPFLPQSAMDVPDFSDVRGQHEARRAFEIAAAGGHHICIIGAPGVGKSMLAKRLPGILPPLTKEEAIESTKIYSVAGAVQTDGALLRTRPFRAPHHSVSAAGLSGGGTVPRPGEISLAHNGVLFLDELPEFHRDALEILRQPLEDGNVTVSRVAGSVTFPSRFMLVTAMNPCPCGYFGHPTRQCTCTQYGIDRYLQKISGPLLDRIDLHVEAMPVEYEHLSGEAGGEDSAAIAARVLAARKIQAARYAKDGILCNAQLTSKLLRKYCRTSPAAEQLLKSAFESMGLSARAYDRVLKVSRTIADLASSERIEAVHVSEAVQYRNLDRKYWYNQ